jgi:hypothetical protein
MIDHTLIVNDWLATMIGSHVTYNAPSMYYYPMFIGGGGANINTNFGCANIDTSSNIVHC